MPTPSISRAQRCFHLLWEAFIDHLFHRPHRIHSPDLHSTPSPDAHQPHLDPANPAGIPDSPESTLPELTPLPPVSECFCIRMWFTTVGTLIPSVVRKTPDMQQDTEDPRLRLYLLGTNRKLPSLEENTPCAGPLVTSFCKVCQTEPCATCSSWQIHQINSDALKAIFTPLPQPHLLLEAWTRLRLPRK
jgi:hypothetical protein